VARTGDHISQSECYRAIKYITQLIAMAAPTKSTKQ
jgi:hypothetical protein